MEEVAGGLSPGTRRVAGTGCEKIIKRKMRERETESRDPVRWVSQ